ncbi:hypothetical protein K435DRAFT_777726 [Dendrothele bispora CBS 962.96]|uniref:Uncharacterized protein n=1 Tax=Dendrothele bispora (strain CBS 962.96) TaxID=1314807 RepID=A0A4S8M6L6_DENBC|nr:hypothetical protein K435DRAFT_777726 [Dendrothele bispora CBS 962.96]
MTEAEKRRVELILGADMDPSELAMPKSKKHLSRKGLLFSPVMTNHLRTENVLDSYAVVDPHSFSSEGAEEIGYEPWIEVVKSKRSDDEISLTASTSSSLGLGGSHWSSHSSSHTSRTNSPEHVPSKVLMPSLTQQSMLAGNLPSGTMRYTNDAASIDDRNSGRSPPNNGLDDSPSPSSVSSASEPGSPRSSSPSRSRGRYIGPELLADPTEATDEEAEFEKFKIDIRIQKIREFHDEAAEADIQFMKDIAEARKSKPFTHEQESERLQKHELDMLKLRKRKEEERKEIVQNERQKKRAELLQRVQSTSASVEERPELQASISTSEGQRGSSAVTGTSDTPTIREHRRQRSTLQMDWCSSGDTVEHATPADGVTDVPPLKKPSSDPDALQLQQLTPIPSSTRSLATPVAEVPVSGISIPKEKTKSVPEQVASSSKMTLEKIPKDSSASLTSPSAPSTLDKTKSEQTTASSSPPSSASTPSSAPGSAKPKVEPTTPSKSPPSSVSRPRIDRKSSSSSIPVTTASVASKSAKAKASEASIPPVTSLTTGTASNSIKPRGFVAEPSPAVTSTTTFTSTNPSPISSSSSYTSPKATPTPSVSSTSASSASASTTSTSASAWTSWAPPPSLPQPSQIPEDRRVWVPPAPTSTTTGKTKNRRPSPSPQGIRTSVSSPETKTQVMPMPVPVSTEERVTLSGSAEAPSPSPSLKSSKSSGVPSSPANVAGSSGSKATDKGPEQSGVPSQKQQSTIATSGSGSGSKPLKATKKSLKQTTVEEVVDEENAAENVGHLPTNSRYIMEPAESKSTMPSVTTEKTEKVKTNPNTKGVKEEAGPRQGGGNVAVGQGRGNGHGNGDSKVVRDNNENADRIPQDAGSSKPTTTQPKHSHSSSESTTQRSLPESDPFLSMLDSLEAMMHSGTDSKEKEEDVRQQADHLNKLLSKPPKLEKEGSGGVKESLRPGQLNGQR